MLINSFYNNDQKIIINNNNNNNNNNNSNMKILYRRNLKGITILKAFKL